MQVGVPVLWNTCTLPRKLFHRETHFVKKCTSADSPRERRARDLGQAAAPEKDANVRAGDTEIRAAGDLAVFELPPALDRRQDPPDAYAEKGPAAVLTLQQEVEARAEIEEEAAGRERRAMARLRQHFTEGRCGEGVDLESQAAATEAHHGCQRTPAAGPDHPAQVDEAHGGRQVGAKVLASDRDILASPEIAVSFSADDESTEHGVATSTERKEVLGEPAVSVRRQEVVQRREVDRAPADGEVALPAVVVVVPAIGP